jgi:hypothetical protein
MMGNQIFPVELLEIPMNQDDKKDQAPSSIEETAIHGMALTEALFEILADKGILTGERVIERIKTLKSEIKVNLSRPN